MTSSEDENVHVFDKSETLDRIRERMAVRDRATSLPTGGGGDNSGGMETRVAKLESDVAHLLREVTDVRSSVKTLSNDLTVVRIDMAAVKTDLSHKPGRGFIFTVSMAIIALLTAVTVYQDKIQHFFGVAHP